MNIWLSVDDTHKPEARKRYLCFANDIVSSWQIVLVRTEDGYWKDPESEMDYYPPIVTHWRDLQDDPKD